MRGCGRVMKNIPWYVLNLQIPLHCVLPNSFQSTACTPSQSQGYSLAIRKYVMVMNILYGDKLPYLDVGQSLVDGHYSSYCT